MTKEITFITGNPNKVDELRRYLSFPIQHHTLDLPEIQSLDVCEVATRKAEAAYQQLRVPVLVEDTSLVFSALGKLPGPFIKYHLEELGLEGLCRLLDPYDDRSAIATTCFSLCDADGVSLFSGERAGTIPMEPRGATSFGWNPVFVPEGETMTWAEMEEIDPVATSETSMRRLALDKVQVYLTDHYQ